MSGRTTLRCGASLNIFAPAGGHGSAGLPEEDWTGEPRTRTFLQYDDQHGHYKYGKHEHGYKHSHNHVDAAHRSYNPLGPVNPSAARQRGGRQKTFSCARSDPLKLLLAQEWVREPASRSIRDHRSHHDHEDEHDDYHESEYRD